MHRVHDRCSEEGRRRAPIHWMCSRMSQMAGRHSIDVSINGRLGYLTMSTPFIPTAKCPGKVQMYS
jgi:hypothetical protein